MPPVPRPPQPVDADRLLEGLRRATMERDAARAIADDKQDDWERLIRAVYQAGVTQPQIAQATGKSLVWVQKVVSKVRREAEAEEAAKRRAEINARRRRRAQEARSTGQEARGGPQEAVVGNGAQPAATGRRRG